MPVWVDESAVVDDQNAATPEEPTPDVAMVGLYCSFVGGRAITRREDR